MIDLLSTLYDVDTIRFGVWHLLHALHLEASIIDMLSTLGYHVWEDWSISR